MHRNIKWIYINFHEYKEGYPVIDDNKWLEENTILQASLTLNKGSRMFHHFNSFNTQV